MNKTKKRREKNQVYNNSLHIDKKESFKKEFHS